MYPPLVFPCYTPSARWATGPGGGPEKKKTKRLVHLKEKTYRLVNWNPFAEAKYSAEPFINFMPSQIELQVCDFADISWF